MAETQSGAGVFQDPRTFTGMCKRDADRALYRAKQEARRAHANSLAGKRGAGASSHSEAQR